MSVTWVDLHELHQQGVPERTIGRLARLHGLDVELPAATSTEQAGAPLPIWEEVLRGREADTQALHRDLFTRHGALWAADQRAADQREQDERRLWAELEEWFEWAMVWEQLLKDGREAA